MSMYGVAERSTEDGVWRRSLDSAAFLWHVVQSRGESADLYLRVFVSGCQHHPGACVRARVCPSRYICKEFLSVPRCMIGAW